MPEIFDVNPEKQAASLVFPLETLFTSGGFDGWLDSVIELRDVEGDEKKTLKQNLREARKKWLQNMEDYEFPVVTLSEKTCAAAVCTIFETLNRTGVKLSVFDLLAARFWPVDVRLRDLWDQAKIDYPIIGEFKEWVADDVEPDTVALFNFDTKTLRTTTVRQRAIYRGVLALILKNGARDLHTGAPITANMMLEKKIEDHHVFPQAFLSEKRNDVPAALRDCVLNRTLIDAETNNLIGKRAPSDYLSEIENSVGGGLMTIILASHLLPDSTETPLWQPEHLEDFLDAREQFVDAQLRGVTQ